MSMRDAGYRFFRIVRRCSWRDAEALPKIYLKDRNGDTLEFTSDENAAWEFQTYDAVAQAYGMLPTKQWRDYLEIEGVK